MNRPLTGKDAIYFIADPAADYSRLVLVSAGETAANFLVTWPEHNEIRQRRFASLQAALRFSCRIAEDQNIFPVYVRLTPGMDWQQEWGMLIAA